MLNSCKTCNNRAEGEIKRRRKKKKDDGAHKGDGEYVILHPRKNQSMKLFPSLRWVQRLRIIFFIPSLETVIVENKRESLLSKKQ